jgi:hypothetical protein
MVKRLLALACFGVLLWAGTAGAITWDIDSQMPVSLVVTDLGGGTYQYQLDITYVDSASSDHSDMIWFILYPEVSNAQITETHGALRYPGRLSAPQIHLPIDNDKDPGPHGQRGVIWFMNVFPDEGMAWGDTGGFTFTSTDYNPNPMDFAYDTIDWTGTGKAVDHDYAAGTTLGDPVPLPPTALLFGFGLVGLFAAGRRRK